MDMRTGAVVEESGQTAPAGGSLRMRSRATPGPQAARSVGGRLRTAGAVARSDNDGLGPANANLELSGNLKRPADLER